MSTPIYNALVIEREGHPTDDEWQEALRAWTPGNPLPGSEHDPDGSGER